MVRYRNFTEAWQFPSIAVLVFSNFFRNFREILEKSETIRYRNFTKACYVPSYGIKSILWWEISELGKNIFAGAYMK